MKTDPLMPEDGAVFYARIDDVGAGKLRASCWAITDYLSHVDMESPLYGLVRQASGFLSRDHAPTVTGHRGMILPGSAEEMYRGLSSKTRQTLKWQAKKLLKELGEVRIHAFREPAEAHVMHVGQVVLIGGRCWFHGGQYKGNRGSH